MQTSSYSKGTVFIKNITKYCSPALFILSVSILCHQLYIVQSPRSIITAVLMSVIVTDKTIMNVRIRLLNKHTWLQELMEVLNTLND